MHRAALVLLAAAVLLLPGCLTPVALDPPAQRRDLAHGRMSVADFLAAWTLPPGDPAPRPALACAELLATLNARALAESDTRLEQGLRGIGRWAFAEGAMASLDSAAPSARKAADAQVTGTNNQEAGVDEADLMKTDGEWTYVLQGRWLNVLHSDRVGDTRLVGSTLLDNRTWGGQLLLVPGEGDGDRLVVITQTWEDQGSRLAYDAMLWNPGKAFTRIATYSLADRGRPALLDETVVEGSVAGARLVDGIVYVVTATASRNLPLREYVGPDESYLKRHGYTWQSYHALKEQERRELLVPLLGEARTHNRAVLANATLAHHLPEVRWAGGALPWTSERCARVLMTLDGTGREATTILALDVGSLERTLTQVLASHPIVYASADALVLATSSRDPWWFWGEPALDESTDLQWFRLDGLTVTLVGSGRVAGTVLNSFAIDVHDGTLRIATTTGQWGRWWMQDPDPMANHLVVLESTGGALTPVGVVTGLALGERIWSARFTGDRAYLVTFRQVDPLWVIDLADPRAPKVLGELEIPGVSTYIHPIDDRFLLTIGYAPQADGQNLDWGRVQVSLFDLRDPSAPRRADVLDVTPGTGWGWSQATREHKAFTYWGVLGKLAIPISLYEERGSDYRVGLRLIDVDLPGERLVLQGDVHQDGLEPPNARWYWGAQVERSYFLGFPGTSEVSVYAVSSLGVSAWNAYTLTPQGQAAFPAPPDGS